LYNTKYHESVKARKSLKYSSFDVLDKALSRWFYQMRAQNIPLSYLLIHHQALKMNDMLGPNKADKFNASNGFIYNFLLRNGFNDSKRLSLIQPMDQCVISALKKIYRRSLVNEMLIEFNKDNDNFDIKTFAKSYDIRQCTENISYSWDQVSNTTLKNSWSEVGVKEYLGSIDPATTIIQHEEQLETENALKQLQLELDKDELNSWYACDSHDPGYQLLSDDEIISELTGTTDDILCEQSDDSIETNNGSISDSVAFDRLNHLLQ
jgi:hypothetical protein